MKLDGLKETEQKIIIKREFLYNKLVEFYDVKKSGRYVELLKQKLDMLKEYIDNNNNDNSNRDDIYKGISILNVSNQNISSKEKTLKSDPPEDEILIKELKIEDNFLYEMVSLLRSGNHDQYLNLCENYDKISGTNIIYLFMTTAKLKNNSYEINGNSINNKENLTDKNTLFNIELSEISEKIDDGDRKRSKTSKSKKKKSHKRK